MKGHWLMLETGKSRDFISRIAGLVMVILSLGIFVAFFIIVRGGRYEDESLTVTGPYDVTFNGENFENVDLSKHDFPSLKKGDHVTYSFTMPDTVIDNAVLTLYFDHAAAKIYFDDKLVYEKGTKDSKMLGYGYVDVNLPVDYAGLRVLVDVDAIENEGLSSLSQPVINNSVIKQHNFIIDTSLYLIIDIAIMQSLIKQENLGEFLSNYAQLIVDECHHLAAYKFEQIAKEFRGKYVLGLTATYERKDGHHPIIQMQCGNIVYKAAQTKKHFNMKCFL